MGQKDKLTAQARQELLAKVYTLILADDWEDEEIVETAEASKFAHDKYNTAKLREMINRAFDDDEFNAFCFDHFRFTYEKFSTGMTRTTKIHLLIEDCYRQERIGELLKLLKRYRQTRKCRSPSRCGWVDTIGAGILYFGGVVWVCGRTGLMNWEGRGRIVWQGGAVGHQPQPAR